MNSAVSFLGEARLTYQKNQDFDFTTLKKVRGSRCVYSFLRPLFEEYIFIREAFFVVFLNRSNTITGYATISEGGISGTVVDPKLVFMMALRHMASGLIIAHNHPSQNLKASRADIDATKKLVNVGKELELPILDHLIICDNEYTSLADEGLM